MRFFFHLQGDLQLRDETGEVLESHEEAVQMGRKLARDLYGSPIGGTLIIEAEDGVAVGEVPLGSVQSKASGSKHSGGPRPH